MPIITFLLQGADAGAAAQSASGLGMLIPLLLIVVIMYLFMIRPQNKKQKELQKMLDALQKGDKVATIGGIHGTVSHINKEKGTVFVKVDDNTKIEFTRNAISAVENEKSAAPAEPKEKKGLFSGMFRKSDGKDSPKAEDKADASSENKTEDKNASGEAAKPQSESESSNAGTPDSAGKSDE